MKIEDQQIKESYCVIGLICRQKRGSSITNQKSRIQRSFLEIKNGDEAKMRYHHSHGRRHGHRLLYKNEKSLKKF